MTSHPVLLGAAPNNSGGSTRSVPPVRGARTRRASRAGFERARERHGEMTLPGSTRRRSTGPPWIRPFIRHPAARAPSGVQLHHVAIAEHVLAVHLLALELGAPPEARVPEPCGDVLVHLEREIVHRGAVLQDERPLQVRLLARLLGVDADAL